MKLLAQTRPPTTLCEGARCIGYKPVRKEEATPSSSTFALTRPLVKAAETYEAATETVAAKPAMRR